MSNLLLRTHMGGRFTQALCLLSLFMLTSFLPSSATATDDWRSVEIDPETWTDGPIKRVHLWMNHTMATQFLQ